MTENKLGALTILLFTLSACSTSQDFGDHSADMFASGARFMCSEKITEEFVDNSTIEQLDAAWSECERIYWDTYCRAEFLGADMGKCKGGEK